MNRLILPSVASLAAGAALFVAAVPAFAQDNAPTHAPTAAWWQPTDVYTSLGYTGINQGSGYDDHIGAVTGRVDARYGKYFGLEGELSGGVVGDHASSGLNTRLDHQYAAYAVGYLPVMRNADLFVRVGYGDSKVRYQGTGGYSLNTESFNYGAGGQYFFTAHDGIRAEYTRQESNDIGPNADTMSVSWVHKF